MKFKESKIQSGLTLIEVVTAVMLMGTLLCLVSRAYRQQWQCASRARIKLTAIRAADQLLAEWASGENALGGWTVPVPAHGRTNVDGLHWKTRLRETRPMGRSIDEIKLVPFNAVLLNAALSNASQKNGSEQIKDDANSAERWLNSQVVQLSIVDVSGSEEKVILEIEFLAGTKLVGTTLVDQSGNGSKAESVQETRPALTCFSLNGFSTRTGGLR